MSGAEPESFVRGTSQNLDFWFALVITFRKGPSHFTVWSMMVPSDSVVFQGDGGPDPLPPCRSALAWIHFYSFHVRADNSAADILDEQ